MEDYFPVCGSIRRQQQPYGAAPWLLCTSVKLELDSTRMTNIQVKDGASLPTATGCMEAVVDSAEHRLDASTGKEYVVCVNNRVLERHAVGDTRMDRCTPE